MQNEMNECPKNVVSVLARRATFGTRLLFTLFFFRITVNQHHQRLTNSRMMLVVFMYGFAWN
jgi:hypothetical protein